MKYLKINFFRSPDPEGAPTPNQPQSPTVEELQARITQLEKDNAELRESYESTLNPQPPTPYNRQDIIKTFGKEFD